MVYSKTRELSNRGYPMLPRHYGDGAEISDGEYVGDRTRVIIKGSSVVLFSAWYGNQPGEIWWRTTEGEITEDRLKFYLTVERPRKGPILEFVPIRFVSPTAFYLLYEDPNGRPLWILVKRAD